LHGVLHAFAICSFLQRRREPFPVPGHAGSTDGITISSGMR
jgi:hypothetical protein